MSATTVRRAIVSTYRKDGVADLARALAELGFEIVSTGGTARLLADAGVRVVKVSDYTGFPEILDGRVKTLHPRIHGGLLADRARPEHVADLDRVGIAPIEILAVNLYPFRETAADPAATREAVVEMIDIGGPAMLRAAAKNHGSVAVLVDPEDYDPVLDELRSAGAVSEGTRRRLAAKAFAHTAAYDAAVASWMAGGVSALPDHLHLDLDKVLDLVYGENPHQKAAFYREPDAAPASIASARHLQGKPLSFNNILDFDAALALASDLARLARGPACVIVKHGNPCGAAVGASAERAFRDALACDPTSAFGGVIALSDPVDGPLADAIAEAFYEGVAAPSFGEPARAVFSRKKNLRLLETGPLTGYVRKGLDLRRVAGGLLAQDWDAAGASVREGRVVTRRAPIEDEWRALEFAWLVVRHVKSNAIVYASSDRTLGIGAGQMSRVDSARFAVEKALHPLAGAVMASDAFFPFRDGLDVGADAGVTAIVQPGGSIRDNEVIAAADERGLAMLFAGRRHFRH